MSRICSIILFGLCTWEYTYKKEVRKVKKKHMRIIDCILFFNSYSWLGLGTFCGSYFPQ